MVSKLFGLARPGGARSRAGASQPPVAGHPAEVIRGFVQALARCEAALARPHRPRSRRRGAGTLDAGHA